MSYELEASLEYGRGSIGVQFDGEAFPENWNDIVHKAEKQVKDALFSLAEAHEWKDSFETAKEYSMPGRSPEPTVGTVTVNDEGEIEVSLSVAAVEDCDWS